MAAVALGLVTVGGVGILLQGHSARSHQVASGCGLINCGSTLPPPIPTTSAQSHISKAHSSVSHPPSAPKQSAPPSATPSQAPAPANVTVTITSDRDRRDFDHFQAQLTLVNQGDSPVSGWTVQLTLPRDDIDSVERQDGRDGAPFDHWQYRGDTLTISADTDSETLGPGAPLDLSIHGRGSTSSPTGCTFNGAACPTLVGQQDQQLPLPQDQPSWQQDQQPQRQDQRSWPGDRQRSWADQQDQGWR